MAEVKTGATYIVSVDTCCDSFKSDLKRKGVNYIALAYIKDGVEYRDDYDRIEQYKTFYESIRKGALPTTTQINETEASEYFEKLLAEQEGDLVHITLSSGLSGTYDSCVAAANAVMQKLPARKIFVVDSLGATQSLTMLTDLALADREAGLTCEACATHLRDVVAHLHHIVMANDLNHFRRGGRVSAASAIFGTLLHIKPIIHVDSKGKLVVIDKVVGIRKSLRYLVDYMKKFGTELENQTLYIAHADCPDLAEELKSLVLAEVKTKVVIGYIGPIIGSHTGTGTIALFFTGLPRWDKK